MTNGTSQPIRVEVGWKFGWKFLQPFGAREARIGRSQAVSSFRVEKVEVLQYLSRKRSSKKRENHKGCGPNLHLFHPFGVTPSGEDAYMGGRTGGKGGSSRLIHSGSRTCSRYKSDGRKHVCELSN